RRRRDRVDAPRGAKFDGGFDIATRCSSGCARFDPRLDVSVNVIEMKNYRFNRSPGQFLIVSHDLVTALQVQRPRGVSKELSVADYYRTANCANFFFGNSLEDDFGTDSRRVSHRDADAWPRARKLGRILIQCIPPANSPARLSDRRAERRLKIQWREANCLQRASFAACARRLCKYI